MSAHGRPKALGGPILDRPVLVLLAIFCVALAVVAYRFFVGLGPVSNMTDGFAWGIWEPVNVVCFTGIGAGAFGLGLLTYVLNKGEYHGLVRPAVLLGAICYTLGGSSIVVALGRYWNAPLLPLMPWWNLASVLLEVAVCVMAYIFVLWIEVLPAVLEGAAASRWPFWARLGRKLGPKLQRLMPYFIGLAIVLPAMHQSSLGGLMLIPESKVYPLWHTALLPTLFLVSCLSMGFGAVVALTTVLNASWNAERDPKLLAAISRVNAGFILFYLALRLGDLAWGGKLRLLGLDGYTLLFAFEIALFAAPAILFLLPSVQRNKGRMFGTGLLAVAAGAVYRVDTYLSVFRPGPGWNYFPSLGEIAVTVGMASVGVAAFIVISRIFPVVVVEERTHPSAAGRPVKAA